MAWNLGIPEVEQSEFADTVRALAKGLKAVPHDQAPHGEQIDALVEAAKDLLPLVGDGKVAGSVSGHVDDGDPNGERSNITIHLYAVKDE